MSRRAVCVECGRKKMAVDEIRSPGARVIYGDDGALLHIGNYRLRIARPGEFAPWIEDADNVWPAPSPPFWQLVWSCEACRFRHHHSVRDQNMTAWHRYLTRIKGGDMDLAPRARELAHLTAAVQRALQLQADLMNPHLAEPKPGRYPGTARDIYAALLIAAHGDGALSDAAEVAQPLEAA